MTRIDLSEYSEGHSVAKLIGAPPGYIGHDAGGQLTEAVRRRPYQIVLLDEIEKAHPDVLTSFLAVFDEGRMTDGRGRLVDFTNTVILMTSNIGAREASGRERRPLGFSSGDELPQAEGEPKVVAAARAALAPELFNRIDEVLPFSPLGRDDVREIAKRLTTKIAEQLSCQRGVRLQVDSEAIECLLDKGGFDPSLGARPMKRTIARLLEAPLAEKILRGELNRGDVVLVAVENGELELDIIEQDGMAADTAAE
jgi:ATP-dependent Clp protease ATP-binding subunit ClpC